MRVFAAHMKHAKFRCMFEAAFLHKESGLVTLIVVIVEKYKQILHLIDPLKQSDTTKHAADVNMTKID